METRVEEVERSNKVLQYLFGPKHVPVTRSKLVGETSYLTAELVSLIENVKNKVQQNHIEDKNREIQNQTP